MRRTLSALLPGVILALAAAPARAQYPGAPPQVSPYLNLARGGPAGINYYGLIRPQQQMQLGLQQMQAALINEQQYAGGQELLANQAVITGNYATYQTQNRYFMTRGTGFNPRMMGYPGGYGASGGYGAAGAMPGFAGPTMYPNQATGAQSGRPPSSGRIR